MPLRKEEIYFKNKYLSTLARLFIIFQLPVSVNSSLINHTAASECIWPCGGLVKTSKPASGCERKMIKQCFDILKQNPGVSLEYSNTQTHTCLRARWRVRGTLTSEAHSHLGVTWQQLKSILTSRKLHRQTRTCERRRDAATWQKPLRFSRTWRNNLHQIAAACAFARKSVCARAERRGRIGDVARRLNVFYSDHKAARLPLMNLSACRLVMGCRRMFARVN